MTPSVTAPMMIGARYLGSIYTATATSAAASRVPIFTHFINVGARALAFNSAVCGDEHAFAIISATIAADTRKAMPLDGPTPILTCCQFQRYLANPARPNHPPSMRLLFPTHE